MKNNPKGHNFQAMKLWNKSGKSTWGTDLTYTTAKDVGKTEALKIKNTNISSQVKKDLNHTVLSQKKLHQRNQYNFFITGSQQKTSGEALEHACTFYWYKFLRVTPNSLRERSIFPERQLFPTIPNVKCKVSISRRLEAWHCPRLEWAGKHSFSLETFFESSWVHCRQSRQSAQWRFWFCSLELSLKFYKLYSLRADSAITVCVLCELPRWQQSYAITMLLLFHRVVQSDE